MQNIARSKNNQIGQMGNKKTAQRAEGGGGDGHHITDTIIRAKKIFNRKWKLLKYLKNFVDPCQARVTSDLFVNVTARFVYLCFSISQSIHARRVCMFHECLLIFSTNLISATCHSGLLERSYSNVSVKFAPTLGSNLCSMSASTSNPTCHQVRFSIACQHFSSLIYQQQLIVGHGLNALPIFLPIKCKGAT